MRARSLCACRLPTVNDCDASYSCLFLSVSTAVNSSGSMACLYYVPGSPYIKRVL
jgi:hypothetical protein